MRMTKWTALALAQLAWLPAYGTANTLASGGEYGISAYAAPGGTGTKAGNANDAPPNEKLVKAVRRELITLSYYTIFDQLSFQLEGSGTVTLSGKVTRPTLRSEAENVTKQVEGVNEVINKIEVLPLSTFDDQIRLALSHKIYGDPTFQRYAVRAMPPIHIIVENGHATLEGFVANELEKNLAGVKANTVHGVFSVANNLQIDSDDKPASDTKK
jgi:hyperosmotically inducible periplasmic protein